MESVFMSENENSEGFCDLGSYTDIMKEFEDK